MSYFELCCGRTCRGGLINDLIVPPERLDLLANLGHEVDAVGLAAAVAGAAVEVETRIFAFGEGVPVPFGRTREEGQLGGAGEVGGAAWVRH